jgi:hypothetical protein
MHSLAMHWKPNPDLYPPYLRARIRRGRGVGYGRDYVPWLKVRDVPSRGTSSVVSGVRIGRSHHLLSELEATYFFLIERRLSTVDIREQWPLLDLDGTLELCARMGLRHRYRGIYPDPFTIDFLITEKVGGEIRYRAASIKTREDAANPEIRHRLSLEHAWCRQRRIPWMLVDTSAFDRTLLSNLRFVRSWFRHRHEPDSGNLMRFSTLFVALYHRNVPLGELIARVSTHLRMRDSDADDLFRYAAWSGSIAVSFKHPIGLNKPLVMRRIPECRE